MKNQSHKIVPRKIFDGVMVYYKRVANDLQPSICGSSRGEQLPRGQN